MHSEITFLTADKSRPLLIAENLFPILCSKLQWFGKQQRRN